MSHRPGRRGASIALLATALAVTALAPATAQSPAPATGLKAVYVSTEPIGVNPFLQLIQQGLDAGGAEFGVETDTIQSADISQLEDNLRAAVEDGHDLIVANSFDSVDAIRGLKDATHVEHVDALIRAQYVASLTEYLPVKLVQ